MYLQFLDLYGNPVYVRPELVTALRGFSWSWQGSPRAATLMVMSNRETFRVRGHVDTIKDAIEQWHRDQIAKSKPLPVNAILLCGNSDPNSAGYRAPVDQPVSRADETRPDGTTLTPLSRSVDCPYFSCQTPGACSANGKCIEA